MDRYQMTFDLHTHTRFFHGKKEIRHAVGTVEENVRAARDKGLKMVGISNHGPGHLTYGLKQEDVPELKEAIERIRERYNDIQIFLGVEANIINPSGNLDVPLEDMENYDYVMAGYHYGILGEKPIRAGCLHALNWLHSKIGGVPTSKLWNTKRVTEAICTSKPMILTHPGDKGEFDIEEIAFVCASKGVWMEINNFHNALSVEGIRAAARYDVTFVIGSDAHTPSEVGCFEMALERALEAGLPVSRINNIEELHGAWWYGMKDRQDGETPEEEKEAASDLKKEWVSAEQIVRNQAMANQIVETKRKRKKTRRSMEGGSGCHRQGVLAHGQRKTADERKKEEKAKSGAGASKQIHRRTNKDGGGSCSLKRGKHQSRGMKK